MDTNSQPQLSDEILIVRARRGDGVSFVELALRHWSGVHRIARNMLSEVSGAREVAEEAFRRALGSLEAFPADVPFRISLCRTVIGLSLARLRPTGPGESLESLLPRFDEHGQLLSSGIWSGSAPALPAETIRNALAHLDVIDRACFVLREIELLSAEEAAFILRSSPQKVRERTHRACLMLTGFFGQLPQWAAAAPPPLSA